jgi:hypothetical protein
LRSFCILLVDSVEFRIFVLYRYIKQA